MNNFKIIYHDNKQKARAGILFTDHGEINTPFFMPVGTLGTVKTIHQNDLKNDIKAKIILTNTYHLYLRPGINTIHKIGGIHNFINWNKPILTDSGGFQIYSLSNDRKITNDGVKFKSYIDGSYHFFSPEKIMEIQRIIGADIIMAFDECSPFPCNYKYATKSMELTHNWLIRCIEYIKNKSEIYKYKQYFFPIIQGSIYNDLRKKSAELISNLNFNGNAIGGLSVGEPITKMYEIINLITDILPYNKIRYLMGVGTPANILESISLGIDMFDCVIPTRNARHGMLFTWNGIINIKNKKWKNDYSLLDIHGNSYVDRIYNKAYLRHLFMSNEYLGKQIASLHNLCFYNSLLKEARIHIINGTFKKWKDKIIYHINKKL